jgi:hypothetical protein
MSDGSKDIIRLPERVWSARFNEVEAHKAIAEIVTKHEEITERMWLVRHDWRRRDGEEVVADALAAATRIREKYADQTKQGQPLLEWDRENWPVLEGWMAALRWAISSESVGEDDSGLYDT